MTWQYDFDPVLCAVKARVYGQATQAQQAECASRLPLSAWALG